LKKKGRKEGRKRKERKGKEKKRKEKKRKEKKRKEKKGKERKGKERKGKEERKKECKNARTKGETTAGTNLRDSLLGTEGGWGLRRKQSRSHLESRTEVIVVDAVTISVVPAVLAGILLVPSGFVGRALEAFAIAVARALLAAAELANLALLDRLRGEAFVAAGANVIMHAIVVGTSANCIGSFVGAFGGTAGAGGCALGVTILPDGRADDSVSAEQLMGLAGCAAAGE